MLHGELQNAPWYVRQPQAARPQKRTRKVPTEKSLEKAPLAAAPRDGISHSHLKKRQPVFYISLALAPTIFGNNLLRFKCFLYGPGLL